jgi:luciferase family oxidoreductase group 1
LEEDFPNGVVELQSYLGPPIPGAKVRATPGEGLKIPIWLLGSSTFSAQLAAMLGLPFAFAGHFAPAYLDIAIEIYRDKFKSSETLREPYALAAVNVAAADTDKEASRLFTSMQVRALEMIRGNQTPLQPPVNEIDGVCSKHEKEAVDQRLRYSFVGGPATVKRDLESFLDRTQVDEIMAVSHMYEHAARLRSYEILSSI